MGLHSSFRRHPTILNADNTILMVIDIQEKLVPAIHEGDRVIAATLHLLRGCEVLGVPVIGTEQYPKGLGPLVPEIRERIDSNVVFSKMTFSSCGAPEAMVFLEKQGRRQILLAGIEAHVCMLQTALDLVERGYQVHVPFDATSSRKSACCETALNRMRDAGIIVTGIESALLEMTEVAGTPEFKEILKIIK